MELLKDPSERAAITAVQDVLSRLLSDSDPSHPEPALLHSDLKMPTTTSKPLRCRSYIKWPSPTGLTFRAGAGPWKVADLCRAYNFPTHLAGGGVIGIVELGGGWTQADLDGFSQRNGLPKIHVTDVSVDGTTNRPGQTPPAGDADGEVLLDIEVSAAAYYYATGKMPEIKVYWSQDIAKAVRKAADTHCDVISISWVADERAWGHAAAQDMEDAAIYAASKKCLVFAASGDNSSSDGDLNPGANVDLPAGCPHVIGCGGSRKSRTSEVVWGDGTPNGNGTGGGFSDLFPTQTWQIGAPVGPGPHPGRMVPDVAAEADPDTGYLIVLNGQQVQIGGTSAVAPLYAGLFASFGKQLGWIAPVLWQNPAAFVDITQGSNGDYKATIAPDPCTGLGVPNGAALAALFAGGPSTHGHQNGAAAFDSPKLEAVRSPTTIGTAADRFEPKAVSLFSIASVVSQSFSFRENAGTPGRVLEQAIPLSFPSGAGAFACLTSVVGAFTTPDFRFLTERPLGRFQTSLGFRGNNLVCTVQLSDSNSDDPISIDVSAVVVFYN